MQRDFLARKKYFINRGMRRQKLVSMPHLTSSILKSNERKEMKFHRQIYYYSFLSIFPHKDKKKEMSRLLHFGHNDLSNRFGANFFIFY